MKNSNNKKIVKICPFITKNFNPDGSRNLENPTSHRFKNDVNWYVNNNFIVVY